MFHCIIHEENIYAELIKFTHGVSKVATCINFIKSSALYSLPVSSVFLIYRGGIWESDIFL
jgi:hypothetical protein